MQRWTKDPAALPPEAGLSATLAEWRVRMGADFAWFGRLGEVPGRVTGTRQLWWSGIHAAGHEAARAMLLPLDDRPVSRTVGLDLTRPGNAWQFSSPQPEAREFWAHAFARNVYLRNDLHEEHRLLIQDDANVIGVAAVAWDKRRVGALQRLSSKLRAGHAHWLNGQVVQAVRRQQRLDAQADGHVVLSLDAGIHWLSAAAQQWLDGARSARLVDGLQRATRIDATAATTVAVDGAAARLTPLHGPHGAAWLAELQPLVFPHADPRRMLTPAQSAVIDWVLAGCTAAETAKQTGKSVETIRSHIKEAYGRLGVANRLELARAMQHPVR